MRMRPRAAVLATTLCLGLTGPVLADTLLTLRTSGEGLPELGQAAVERSGELWIGANAMREDRAGQSVIVNLEVNRIYLVDHERASYQEVDLPLRIRDLLPPEMVEAYDQFTAQLEMDVEITPTADTREILGHRCRKYEVASSNAALQMAITLWVTQDVDFDLAAYRRMSLALAGLQPAGSEWMKKVLAIDGFPVLKEVVVSVLGQRMTTREELVSIEEKPAPAGHYLPPSGYAPEPFDLTGAFPDGP